MMRPPTQCALALATGGKTLSKCFKGTTPLLSVVVLVTSELVALSSVVRHDPNYFVNAGH